MALAIPGGLGLFSTLQEAFRHPTADGRLRLCKHVHDFLEDFCWLAKEVRARPTRIDEIIPNTVADAFGACDAAGPGMGGVWFIPTETKVIPVLWHDLFLTAIQKLTKTTSTQKVLISTVINGA